MNTTVTLQPAYFSRRSLADWGFALLSLLGMVYAFVRYQHAMDGYEQAILVGTWPAVVWLAGPWGGARQPNCAPGLDWSQPAKFCHTLEESFEGKARARFFRAGR